MAVKRKSVSFLKKYWVSSIGVFLLSQIIFITFEATGWIPNYREINGTIFGTITEAPFFKEWFTFYETPYFNLIIVFFGVFFLVPGIISAIKNVFLPSHHSNDQSK